MKKAYIYFFKKFCYSQLSEAIGVDITVVEDMVLLDEKVILLDFLLFNLKRDSYFYFQV